MKTEFKNFVTQMTYITKLVNRKTDLEIKCQVCGENAMIVHNKKEPYKIKMICHTCRTNLTAEEQRKIPYIDLEKFIQPSKIFKYMKVSEEDKKIVYDLIDNNYSKSYIYKKYNITPGKFKCIAEEIQKEDADIFNKINKAMYRAFSTAQVNAKLKCHNTHTDKNNLVEIKKKRNLSNRDLERMSNGMISQLAITKIVAGKTNPSIHTKAVFAEILGMSIADIFNNCNEFRHIHNTLELKEEEQKIITMLNNLDKSRKYLKKLHKNSSVSDKLQGPAGIDSSTLYRIMNGTTSISEKNFKKFFNYF